MPRIKPDAPNASTPSDDMSAPDIGTAERVRPKGMHEPMHTGRDGEFDGRDDPRLTSAEYEYRLPLTLDAPPPRPGMRQRWVRSEFRSESDNLNWQQKLREGWRPRDPATVDQAAFYFGETSRQGQDVIRVGGMILMEMPEERVLAKRKAIDEITRRQEQSVLSEADKASREGAREGLPAIEGDVTTRVQTGRRPNTLAD